MKRFRGVCALLAVVLATLFLLTGCSFSGNLTLGGGAQTDGRKSVTVSSTEELFQAVAPDTRIVIKAGNYNMSRYIEKVWEDDPDAWNAAHPYVRIEECYDGAMAVITGVNGLTITGGTDKMEDTELVVRPLYADVISFEDCVDLEVRNLTMGHLEAGDCSGSVVYLDNCRGSTFENVDLYGCGVMGLEADFCRGLTVKNSTLRDCSWCSGALYGCRGDILFEDCVMTGSSGGVKLWDNDDASVVFRRCVFGEDESYDLWFEEDAVFEDCQWDEVVDLPEYEWDPDDFRNALNIIPFDPETFRNTGWTGIWITDEEEEYDGPLPEEAEVNLFVGDEDARLDGLGEENVGFDTWAADPDNDAAVDFLNEQGDPVAVGWVYDAEEDGELSYLELDMGEKTVWFVINQG